MAEVRGLLQPALNIVNPLLTIFVGHRERRAALMEGMDSPFIAGRLALAEASELMDRFGEQAGPEAAARAERSRDAGNVLHFCHWRQIERMIETLSSDQVRGTVH